MPETPPKPAPPRSDVGTILLHWSLAIAIVVSLLTGLRFSADAENSVFASSLEIILPQGEMWTWHFYSALVVLGGMVAYVFYLSVARLRRRVSVKKTIVLTLPASPKLKWSAVNVILYWCLFLAVIALAATGFLLYLGWGGIVVDLHFIASMIVGSYIILHVISHYMFGGIGQLLRLFRPQPLRFYRGMMARPFATAFTGGVIVAAFLAITDFSSRGELIVAKAKTLPVLDGEMSDEVWSSAEPVFIHTQQGSSLGGTGESTVEIRAVRVGDKITFAFRWEDPSRSLMRHPLVKKSDGWHMLNNRANISDETDFYEDKFSVMFSTSDAFGSGKSTHMGPKPLADQPGALNSRGLHYTLDENIIDVWQWKGARGGMLGRVDDMLFGPPIAATDKQRAGKSRYSGGYTADKGTSFYVYNYAKKTGGNYGGTVNVKRLPKDYPLVKERMGKIDLTVGASVPEGSQWWMTESDTVEYSPELDETFPEGSVLPGVLIMGEYTGSRADLKGGSKWKDGYWTLEIERSLKTGNDDDLDLVSGLYIWVAVFDHNQTRHTRHARPVKLIFNDDVI
jgi:cytochrome b561